MDLQTFRQVVDSSDPGIASCDDEPHRLYDYIGLQMESSFASSVVSDALYSRIRDAFTSGHAAIWQICRSLRTDLIREHVLRGTKLEPYLDVIDHLADAIRIGDNAGSSIEGDWSQAIRAAYDHTHFRSWGDRDPERLYSRDFKVAKAARALSDNGFAIHLEPGRLSLEETSERAVVATIEDIIAKMGGVNVARRIFKEISPLFDPEQQRYHVVRRVSMTDDGTPQIPWGYLIQLAAKHAQGSKPYIDTDFQWHKLCSMAQAFGAVIDVQPYTPKFFGSMDAFALLPLLKEIAVYDTLFCIPQMRPTDVVKLARGMLDWMDPEAPTNSGWSIEQALEITSYLLSSSCNVRGPIFVDEADVRRACPAVPREIVAKVLDEVLSHPTSGANRNFSNPADAPAPGSPQTGHDFFLRPLLRSSGRRFILLDCSVCAPACIEALLTALRPETKSLDDKVGLAVERFLKAELASHGIAIGEGDYDSGGEHGECDLVIETPEAVIFAEIKKKPLTRRAKAGSDAALILDLAGSLLAAQAQAGWHEVRLRRDGHLDLEYEGVITRLGLSDREVERVAVSLLDYGGFQDRTLLKQFLEGTMNANFMVSDARLTKKFAGVNESLAEIRDQVALLHPGAVTIDQPFFHCWFISVPQLLVLLDGVTDSLGFKNALWSSRHIVTGSSDLYFDLSYMRRLRKESITSSGPLEMS
ncbi:hypothetical protein [Pseudomonas lactis]|uniref:hypothetical protein n=1 Tax=Pseudomonas lactis TaxID=1615674 RepID=UPI001A0106CD|nr:hypothetical protein [Pseudomonas lactis]MBA6043414.1 hypothetical protein [Pseudomonas lactis]